MSAVTQSTPKTTLVLEGNPPFESPAAETREKLLAATARASRLLLESPNAMKAMPDVLRLLGEAAEVHRTALALAEIDAGGERWLVIKDEWIADDLTEAACNGETCGLEPDQYSDIYCSMLQTGKSILYCRDTMPEREAVSITSDKARSSAIVPILVDGEYVGVIGFDDWRRARQFDSSIVSALEIAAGLVGAALYRERLLETMRLERERAAEERLTQLDRANATLRANLNRLAGNPDVRDFIANMLLDASRQLDAAACYAAGLDEQKQWRIFLYVENGKVGDPPFPAIVPGSNPGLADLLEKSHGPVFFELDKLDKPLWPEATRWHQQSGHRTAYLLPLVFGERNVGFLTLVFRQSEPLTPERMQVVLALAHQATLAIGMKKLGIAAKEAAVLAERNRIGQEIHDGLAQGFTGILMQLGAAEEAISDCARSSPLPSILTRIRDLAKEGLTEARRSVMALRPEQTRRIGLEFALRQLAERSTVQGRVECMFEGGMSGEGLAPEHQHELLRIAQEAVGNAMRHAHPSNVRIGLQEGPTMWVLTVTDDGRGMEELSQYAAQGFGLTNMRERASAIGGQWRVHSKLGKGTQVVVSLPRPHA